MFEARECMCIIVPEFKTRYWKICVNQLEIEQCDKEAIQKIYHCRMTGEPGILFVEAKHGFNDQLDFFNKKYKYELLLK